MTAVDNSSDIPPVLAGPILRKIEHTHIALWLATTDCYPVRLTLAGQTINPTVTPIKGGNNLYFLLIEASLDNPFPQDEWIEYQIELNLTGKNWWDITMGESELLYPGRKKLGFKLPSYVGSVLHGSCRKPHHPSGDGLVVADNLLEDLLTQESPSTAWPSMLVMSGDQIYADDVAGPMLRAIHSIIQQLTLPAEDLSEIEIPGLQNGNDLYQHSDCYYRRDHILPKVKGNLALLDTLFGGVRKPVFTTDTAQNHLITLHEHLIMYLMVWSPLPWRFASMEMPKSLDEKNQKLYQQEKVAIDSFITGLTKVRRLLAHIPVAMIFDDHDITDDWNLNRHWETTVYDHPFSRRMVGNALIAYMLCQGWGNNPSAFYAEMMDHLAQAVSAPGSQCHEEFVNEILAFQGWEYRWDTQPPLIVMDTRTRRWRSESSMVKPSGLLDWEALGDLQSKLYGNDSVLLVSPAPIYGVKLIEAIQRIVTWFGKPLVVDAENWMAHPGTANAILNIFMHRKTPHHVVILSGDVHYSFVYDVELKKHDNGPDIWQVSSSGLKNEFPKRLLATMDLLNRWLFTPASPLNWFTQRRRMRIIPRKPEGHADGRRLLNAAGIGLIELDKEGRPTRISQHLCSGKAVEFNRMEHHSHWR